MYFTVKFTFSVNDLDHITFTYEWLGEKMNIWQTSKCSSTQTIRLTETLRC